MHNKFGSSLGFAFLSFALPLVCGVAGCSTPRDTSSHVPAAQRVTDIANLSSKLTTACRLETVGLPCDPDGEGSATECEGLCWVDERAEVSCVAVNEVNLLETDLNGRICGDEQGRDCSRSCENGQCVDKNARLGTACRPGPNTTSCEGVCTLVDGEPSCDAVSVCDAVGISDDGCTLTACNFEQFEQGCAELQLSNAVCEASQNELDASVSSEADASQLVDSGVDAAATGNNDGGSTSMPAEAGATRTSNATSRSSNTNAIEAGLVDAALVDAALSDSGSVVRTPVRVVGGACAVTPTASSHLGALTLLALGSLFLRRKRALKP